MWGEDLLFKPLKIDYLKILTMVFFEIMNAGCVEKVTRGGGATTIGGPPYPWLIFFCNGQKLRHHAAQRNAI